MSRREMSGEMSGKEMFRGNVLDPVQQMQFFSFWHHGSVTDHRYVLRCNSIKHWSKCMYECTLHGIVHASWECCRTKLVVDCVSAPHVWSSSIGFVWRVFRPINWTRDYILQDIYRKIDIIQAQPSSGSSGTARLNNYVHLRVFIHSFIHSLRRFI